MSDEINIGNLDQTHGVAVGSNNQAVNVTIGNAPLPPELQNGTIREIALSTARGMMEVADRLYWLQDTYKEDRERDLTERYERQRETDEHRKQITERLDTIDRQIQLPAEHLGRIDGQVHTLVKRIDGIDEQLRVLGTRTAVALAGVVLVVLIGVALYVTYAT